MGRADLLLARALALAGFLLLAGAPEAAGGAPDCSAYSTLQEWNGKVHYTWSAQYTLDTTIVQRSHDASVSVHLARQTPDVPGVTQIAFEGPGLGTVSIHDRYTDTTTGDVTYVDGAGTPIYSAGQGGINLTLDLTTCKYSWFWSVNVDGTVTTKDGASPTPNLGLGKVQVQPRDLPVPKQAPLDETASLPARGLLWLFQGLPDDAYIAYGDIDDPPGSAGTDWNLVPGPPEEEELIVSIPAYDSWLPEGGTDEVTRPQGKELEIRATVQKKGGGAPKFPPKSIHFEMLSRSSEPGVAMNFPQKSKLESPARPDLRFDQDLNTPKMLKVPDEDGASADTTASPPDGKATALLSTYDWGGYGILQVTAVAADGTQLTGTLDTDSSKTQIEIPKRTLPSRIADSWKNNLPQGIDDRDDSETTPAGDGGPGDGLSLYEEYRGFVLNGTHSRKSQNDKLDPQKKDVFVRNCIAGAALEGIREFQRGTKLVVHSRIRDDELPSGKGCPGDVDIPDSERVINFNSSSATHIVDEHAIVLIKDTNAEANIAVGSPGLPRQVNRVVIADTPELTKGENGRPVPTEVAAQHAYYARTVAHELGHSVNVYHHGRGDKDVEWRLVGDTIVEQEIEYQENQSYDRVGPAYEIVVLDEANQPVPLAVLGLPRTVDLGVQHGPHSGHQDCFMRYESAEAFEPAPPLSSITPPIRYWVGSETAGDNLCNGAQGTGVNDANARPLPPGPRYGNADTDLDRGNCVGQVRVNDSLPDKSRGGQ
jgi:hypothetical protein